MLHHQDMQIVPIERVLDELLNRCETFPLVYFKPLEILLNVDLVERFLHGPSNQSEW
jgi:hypothetical protein